MTFFDQLPTKTKRRIVIDDNGCWLWQGYKNANGYVLAGGRRGGNKHRQLYQQCNGPVPRELDLDHLCRVRHCLNPDHLEPVTRRVNLLRGDGPRVQRERAKKQTHCKHGHEFTPENTYINARHHRCCRMCARLRARTKRAYLRTAEEEMRLAR